MCTKNIGNDLEEVVRVPMTKQNKGMLENLISDLNLIRLPSSHWEVHVDSKHTILTFSVNFESNGIKTHKSVVIAETDEQTLKIDTLMDNVYVRIPYVTKPVSNIQGLTYFLNCIDTVKFCKYYFNNNRESECSVFSLALMDSCSYCLNKSYNTINNIKNTNNEKWMQTPKNNKDILQNIAGSNAIGCNIQCILCSKNFKTKEHLEEHENSHLHRNSIGQLECTVCSHVYNSVAAIIKHYNECHSAIKFLKCTTCSRKYNSLKLLKKHTWNHMRHMRFACDHCEQYFSSKLNLKKHSCVNSQRSGTASGTTKAFICSTCKIKYATESLLHQHQKEHKVHVSLVCRRCIIHFESEEQAVAHKIRCKNEQTKYFCKTCKKKFSCISQKICHLNREHHLSAGSHL